jgi:hypothetical protein
VPAEGLIRGGKGKGGGALDEEEPLPKVELVDKHGSEPLPNDPEDVCADVNAADTSTKNTTPETASARKYHLPYCGLLLE